MRLKQEVTPAACIIVGDVHRMEVYAQKGY